MKKINFILILLLLSVGFTACMKDQEVYDPQEHLELEAPIIASYVDKDSTLKGIAQKDESGIWYVVESEGSGDYDYEKWLFPDITVKYSGKLLNGTEFDNSDKQPEKQLTINLNNVIYAWQVAIGPATLGGKEIGGITLNGLQKGAKIRIVTPSPYGYQSQVKGSIPANSPLDFTIEIIDLKLPVSQQ